MAGVLLAALVCFVAYGSATQEAKAQTQGSDEPTFTEGAQRESVPGEIIVKLVDDASQQDLRELNRQNDARTEEDLPNSGVNLVDLPRDLTVREAIVEYEDSPDVEYAEPNFTLEAAKTANDAYYSRIWGLHNTGQTIAGTTGVADADIDAPEAWDITTGSGTPVAIIDTGVDISHPDLAVNVWTNPGEISGNGVDDDNNGYVDDIHGWDFYNDDASVYDSIDGDEHGTHVAGTIAAAGNNGTGVPGVNWQAKIVPLKFLGPNGGTTLDAVAALNYAVKEGVKISNNSWGGGRYSQALRDAIARADANGHLFVAAAGNGGSDGIGDNNDGTAHYPSNYDVPNVIAVAASGNRDTLAGFSNYGANTVDLAAPGVDIASTLPGNDYAYYSGTSMATPHVAGVAALIKSKYPLLDDGQIKGRILGGVDKKAAFANRVLTGGRLNAFASLTQTASPVAQPAPPPSDTTRPTISSVRPVPNSRTRDRTPTVAATVRDDRTNLTKSAIRLYVDGRLRTTFSYNTAVDRLSYTPRLSYARHKVRIVASDTVGNTATKSWSFKVIRR